MQNNVLPHQMWSFCVSLTAYRFDCYHRLLHCVCLSLAHKNTCISIGWQECNNFHIAPPILHYVVVKKK